MQVVADDKDGKTADDDDDEQWFFTGSEDCDLTDSEQIRKLFDGFKPTHVLFICFFNCWTIYFMKSR